MEVVWTRVLSSEVFPWDLDHSIEGQVWGSEVRGGSVVEGRSSGPDDYGSVVREGPGVERVEVLLSSPPREIPGKVEPRHWETKIFLGSVLTRRDSVLVS